MGTVLCRRRKQPQERQLEQERLLLERQQQLEQERHHLERQRHLRGLRRECLGRFSYSP